MGSIIERTKKDGSISYQAMVKIPGSKAAVKTYETREDAQRFIDEMELRRRLAVHEKSNQRATTAKSRFELAMERQEIWENSWLNEVMAEYVADGQVSERERYLLMPIRNLSNDMMLWELDSHWQAGYVKRARAAITQRGKPFSYASILGHMCMISKAMRWKAQELRAEGRKLPCVRKHFPDDWEVKRDRRLSAEEGRAYIRRFMKNPNQTRRRHWIRRALDQHRLPSARASPRPMVRVRHEKGSVVASREAHQEEILSCHTIEQGGDARPEGHVVDP